MTESKENHDSESFLTEDELDEMESLFTIIANKYSKKHNTSLFRTHVLNYFNLSENIDKMTADPDNFVSLTQLEAQTELLIQNTIQLAKDLTSFKLSNLKDEGLILQKKKNT
ncbi:MAG: hypothetical protein LBE38_01650 [Deltaproteobacteria bacterium]|jgi:hypothetical protein|nr:hypothetical protein [Deltaproteobacteria bacterium]